MTQMERWGHALLWWAHPMKQEQEIEMEEIDARLPSDADDQLEEAANDYDARASSYSAWKVR